MTNENENRLLTEREVAEQLNLSFKTVRNWRCKGEGPRWRKLGRRAVRYRLSDVEAFIAGNAEGNE